MKKVRKKRKGLKIGWFVVIALVLVILGFFGNCIRFDKCGGGPYYDCSLSREYIKCGTLDKTEPDPPIATESNPITLSRESTFTNSGDIEVLSIGIFNPTESTFETEPLLVCNDEGVESSSATGLKSIEPNQYERFLVGIETDGASIGRKDCKITANIGGEVHEKDFTINIIK